MWLNTIASTLTETNILYTDGYTDRQTDRQADSSIPPENIRFAGEYLQVTYC